MAGARARARRARWRRRRLVRALRQRRRPRLSPRLSAQPVSPAVVVRAGVEPSCAAGASHPAHFGGDAGCWSSMTSTTRACRSRARSVTLAGRGARSLQGADRRRRPRVRNAHRAAGFTEAFRRLVGDDQVWTALVEQPLSPLQQGALRRRPGSRDRGHRRADRDLRRHRRPAAASAPMLPVARSSEHTRRRISLPIPLLPRGYPCRRDHELTRRRSCRRRSR
jgi:hypothetical protein